MSQSAALRAYTIVERLQFMLRWVSSWLYRISNGWVALFALTVFLLFTALVLPRQAAQADAIAAGADSPDTSLWYTTSELYGMAEAHGEQGRAAYVRARYTFDVVWPLMYASFLCTAISWACAKAFTSNSPWRLANLVPLFGVLFDYLENLSTSVVMLRYPDRTPVIDALAPVLTLAKWLFVGGSFALLLVGIAVAVWRWTRKGGRK
jgi:hypothetical protein